MIGNIPTWENNNSLLFDLLKISSMNKPVFLLI